MRLDDFTGKRFGRLLVTKRGPNKIQPSGQQSTVWCCDCDCGTKDFSTVATNLKNGHTKSCGCYLSEITSERSWKGHGEISGAYWCHIKSGANNRARKLPVEVSIEYIWKLFLDQERKCAISGVELVFSRSRTDGEQTASLDRIDSSLGYVEGNLQWVHKDIQNMKWDSSQKNFINWCHTISDHNRRAKP